AGIYARLHYAKAWIDDWPIDDPAAVGDQDLVGLVEQAIALAERADDRRAQAYGLGLLGKLRDRAGANDAARRLTEQGLGLASQVQAPEIAYRLWWQLGQLEARRGNRPSAIAAYNQAIDTLRSVRTDLAAASADVQYSFRETVEPIYRELAGLLLRPEADRDELDQARKIIEGLQLAELDNFFRDACSTARPVRIDEIDSRAAAIYTIILDDRLEAIAALPNGQLLRHTTRMPRAEILAAINDMRGSINKPVLTFLRQGYDWLIRPFEPAMATAGVKTLVFVLDGELRSVPPAALHDGKQFAIEHYGIAIAPGLQFLPSSRATRSSTQNPLLAAGISESRQGFAPLPNVPTELQEITQNLPGTVLLDPNFTEPNFLARLENVPFPIVHIATHGQFSSNADRTFLLTWDDRINSRDLDRLFRLPNRDRIPIDLLVLSACTTAKGDSRAALGLAGVSVRAGARTTLATLWQVNDAATATLVSRFYQALLDGKLPKGEALRQAQRSLIADPKTRLPFYWAAFILVGDWQ
ncbi:MAG TPA: CHAT domain-containing protein, partial [Coleofasciculaceae cyanobacterium]